MYFWTNIECAHYIKDTYIEIITVISSFSKIKTLYIEHSEKYVVGLEQTIQFSFLFLWYKLNKHSLLYLHVEETPGVYVMQW